MESADIPDTHDSNRQRVAFSCFCLLLLEHDLFGENSFVFGVFGSWRGLQANDGTVRKSAISSQLGNQNDLIEAILLI